MKIPNDLAYLNEAVGDRVYATNPSQFVDDVIKYGSAFTYKGSASSEDAFRKALAVPSEEPEPEPEPEAEPPSEETPVLTKGEVVDHPPEPEEPQSEFLTSKDEETFLWYLRTAYREAYQAYRSETALPDSDRLYLQELTKLMHTVEQLETQYEQPGTVTQSQHTGNVRRINGLIDRVDAIKPDRSAADAETSAESAEQEKAPESAKNPSSRPRASSNPLTATAEHYIRNLLRNNPEGFRPFFALSRTGRLTKKHTGADTEQAAEEVAKALADETDQDWGGFDNPTRNRWLRFVRSMFHKIGMRNPGKIRDLLSGEGEVQESDLILGDPILRMLFEQQDVRRIIRRVERRLWGDRPVPTLQLVDPAQQWLRVWPDKQGQPGEYYDVFTRVRGGWPQTRAVRVSPPVPARTPTPAREEPQPEPEPGDEETIVMPPSDREKEIQGISVPTPEPASQKATQAEPSTEVEHPIAKEVEAALEQAKDFQDNPKKYNAEQLKNRLLNLWRQINVDLDLQRKRPDLKPALQLEINNIRDALRKGGDPEQTQPLATLDNLINQPDAFLRELRDKATQYKTEGVLGWWSLWPWNRSRLIGRLIGRRPRIAKYKETEKGNIYKVIQKGLKPMLFFVPNKQNESMESILKMGAFLESVMAEQAYDVSDDPKAEAPPEAFGVRPVPPSGDPVGVAQRPEPSEPEPPAVAAEPPEDPVKDKPKIPERVLVTQNGTWWVLSWDNWLQFLVQGASGSRWNLDNWGARLPEGKPTDVRRFITLDPGPNKYYSTDPATNVYYVQGWQPKRFRDELNYIQAMDVADMSMIEPKPPADEGEPLSVR